MYTSFCSWLYGIGHNSNRGETRISCGSVAVRNVFDSPHRGSYDNHTVVRNSVPLCSHRYPVSESVTPMYAALLENTRTTVSPWERIAVKISGSQENNKINDVSLPANVTPSSSTQQIWLQMNATQSVPEEIARWFVRIYRMKFKKQPTDIIKHRCGFMT